MKKIYEKADWNRKDILSYETEQKSNLSDCLEHSEREIAVLGLTANTFPL